MSDCAVEWAAARPSFARLALDGRGVPARARVRMHDRKPSVNAPCVRDAKPCVRDAKPSPDTQAHALQSQPTLRLPMPRPLAASLRDSGPDTHTDVRHTATTHWEMAAQAHTPHTSTVPPSPITPPARARSKSSHVRDARTRDQPAGADQEAPQRQPRRTCVVSGAIKIVNRRWCMQGPCSSSQKGAGL
jgi:hypothetical protein